MSVPTVKLSEFARTQFGMAEVTATALRRYGQALLVIAGSDGEVSPSELRWLIDHQRRFGVPEAIVEEYRVFDYHAPVDLGALAASIQVDYAWVAGPTLVYHAIQMSSADGEYAAGERARVAEAAAAVGVSSDLLAQLEALVALETSTATLRRTLLGLENI
ncbi:hypothetical protein [Streptomyces sp. NPDC057702]|uniref:hypothetical protein n=1 Tax=unclassified Streptomyces TaxID=2593676 RepID=UPI0036C53E0D